MLKYSKGSGNLKLTNSHEAKMAIVNIKDLVLGLSVAKQYMKLHNGKIFLALINYSKQMSNTL